MREVPVQIVSAAHAAPRMSRRMEVLLTLAIAIALLIPCVWQEHIEAGDLASHLYNAWLAGQIQNGTIAGLTVAHPLTNVLSDGIMAALIGPLGPTWTARLVCAAAVETFFWGAFFFISAANRRKPWILAPSLGMLTYGMIFHFGFLNFYISTGCSLWILALLWNPSRLAFLQSIPLAVLALLAHPLPLAWAVCVLAYVQVARRLRTAGAQVLLLLAAPAALILIQTVLLTRFASEWSLSQALRLEGVLGATGALQFCLYGSKYLLIAAGMLLLWFYLFLERVDRGKLISDPLVHVWLLNIAALVLIPSSIKFPQYQFGLLFISERISLFIAILFCAVIGGGSYGRAMTRLSSLVAIVFFTFVFIDVSAVNAVDAEITSLVSGLAPGQRVVASLQDSTGLNSLVHVLDWACIGRCFDYANYEPGTGQFRIRVLRRNQVVAPTIAIAQEIEYGHHIVAPDEAPLYSICPGPDSEHRLRLQKMKAGDATCGFTLPTTFQPFGAPPTAP
ncbi:MAG TPA: hypothetical protein VGQ49_02300 [Bryobacteraceae bacterium]|nr:hypothetical protein [Bryobacteraceae bacterium]